MKIFSFLFIIMCFWATPLLADEFSVDDVEKTKLSDKDEILLQDGTILKGKILEENEDFVIFEVESLGRLEIKKDRIKRIARGGEMRGVLVDPDQNSIMFCPTPATIPKGSGYFRDYELFILNFGFGLTDDLDLSIGTLFPLSASVIMLSVGAKWRVLDRDEGPLGFAVVGNFTKLEENHFGGVGAVAGVGNAQKSLNFSVNRTFDNDGDNETVFLVGADFQSSRKSKVFAEYFNSSSLLTDEDGSLDGFINIGIRLFGISHSFSFSGFRPLQADSGSFIAFPMVMYSHHW